jgi:hypothetical protein
MKTISNGRQPQNINSEYLSNHLLDHTQILNLSLYDQTILCKGRPPPMEDDLKILKVEHLSNHLLDPTQILNLCLDDQTILYKSLNEDDLQWKKTSKYQKWKTMTYEFLGENLRKTQRKSRVWLCSAQLVYV